MSETLTRRLGLTKLTRKEARILVDHAMQRMKVDGPTVLPMDTMLLHRGALFDCRTELTTKGRTDTQKLASIEKAKKVVETADTAIKDAKGFKLAHHTAMRALYDDTFAKTITPMREALDKAVPGNDYPIQVISELSDNFNGFAVALRQAANPQDARKAFDDAKAAHLKLDRKAKELKAAPAGLETAAKDRIEARKRYDALLKDLLALEMANVPEAGDMSKRLYAALSQLESGQPTEARTAFGVLATDMRIVARKNQAAAEQALAGPRQEAVRLRGVLAGYVKGPQGRLSTVKGVLGTIGGKLDILDLFLNGNNTPQSAMVAKAMAEEIASMLTEVGGMDETQDKKNRDAVSKVKSQLTARSLPLFKGDGTLAKELLPKRYNALELRRKELDELIEGMRMSEVTKAMETLQSDASTLITDAAAFQGRLDGFRNKLKAYKATVGEMDKILEADRTIKSELLFGFKKVAKKMAGPFAAAVAAFETSLGTAQLDEGDILKKQEKVEELLQGHTPLVPATVTAEYRKAKADERAFEALKATKADRITEAETDLAKAANLVGKSKPGDTLELKVVTAAVKNAVKQVRAATTPAGLEDALLELDKARKGARQLAQNPQGDAPDRRGKLGNLAAAWHEAADGVASSLAEIGAAVEGASNLDSDGKKEIKAMIAAAARRFSSTAFDKVIADMTTNPSNENLPARIKAREEGLRLVRQYRDAMTNDPLITSLVLERPFSVSAITQMHQALNNLDLNLSRAV